MPEINIKVKIIGGKKTPFKMFTESCAISKKIMALFSDADIEIVIHGTTTEPIQPPISRGYLDSIGE